MESQQAKKISVSRRVINAILKLQKSNGVSLVNLKKYLRDEKNLDVEKHNEEIKLALKSGLDRDVLTRENGMYKAKKISVSRRVINAILKLQKSNGVSLVNLKKYLRDEKNLDVEKHNEEIKLALKSGLDRDVLTRENGMYKVKGVKRGRDKGASAMRERSKSRDKGASTMCERSKSRDKGASTMRERSKSRQKSSKQESSTRKRSPSDLIRKKASVKK